MKNENFYDDGNWCWYYQCIYIQPTNDPNDWFYEIAFETSKGGYLNDEEITCYYFPSKNLLSIYKGKNSKIDFFVKNFNDINVIIFPMIESNNCKIYKKFESREKTKIKH